MSETTFNQIAKDAAKDFFTRCIEAGGDGEDVVFALECLCGYVLGATVMPGHDRELVEDVSDGIALALVAFRRADGAMGARH